MKHTLLAAAALLLCSAAQAQWANQRPNISYSLTDVMFVSPDTGYATAAIGGMIKTTDGGTTWNVLNTGINPSLRNLWFVNADSGYVVGNAGTMARTTDGGRNWTMLNNPNNQSSFNGVYFPTFNEGFVTMGDVIFRTQDAGQTWDTAYAYNGSIPVFTFRSLNFPTPQVGYAVGGYSGSFGSVGEVAKTTDGGLTWNLLPTPPQMRAIAAAAYPSASTIYLQDIMGMMNKSTDGGQTWTSISINNMPSFYAMTFLDPNHGFGAGYNSGVMETMDGGQTWTVSAPANNETWAGMFFPTKTVGYVVGSSNLTADAMIMKYTAPVVGRPEQPATGISLYPNPARGSVTLRGLADGTATVHVLNLQGRQLRTEQVRNGQLSTAGLAAGLYLVQVQTAAGTELHKLVLQ